MTARTSATLNPRSSAAWRLVSLAVFLAFTSAVAALGSIATRSGQEWYDSLEKPVFNPPDWVFGAVWTPLYVFIAVAAWLVYREERPGRAAALTAWGLQLALNLVWSWLFFGAERPGLALILIAALFVAIAVTAALFARLNRAAAAFLLPYLVWVGFASLLNFEVWWLN